MLRKHLLIVLAASTMGSAAMAQQVSYGEFGLSVGGYKFDGERFNVLSGKGEIGITAGNMDFWTAGEANALQSVGGDNFELRALSFGAGYSFGNGVRADLSYNDISVGLTSASVSLSFYELGVSYQANDFFGRIAYAHLTDDIAGLDGLYSVMAGYNVSPATTVSLSAHWLESAAAIWISRCSLPPSRMRPIAGV